MRRLALAALLAALALLQSGCWDLREINHLALVMAVGIDQGDQPGRVRVTIQVARPSAETKGAGPSKGGGNSVFIATADGDTIFAAIRNLAQFTSRRIMWAQNNIVIIGEELARDDISPVVDFFTRNQELRMRTWIAVARGGEAREIVTAATGMEHIPAVSLSQLLRYAQLPGEAVRSAIGDVMKAYLTQDLSPVMAALELKPRRLQLSGQPEAAEPQMQAVLSGSAIFKGTSLVGYADRDVGRGLLWARREMRNAVLTLPCPGTASGHMAAEVRRPKVKVKSYVTGQTPSFQITVDTLAWLTEQDCATPNLDTMTLKRFAEAALAREIEADIRQAAAFFQEVVATDAANFARLLHIQHPAWWRAHAQRWDEIFPAAKIKVAATVKIRKMSLYTRPTMGTIR